LAMDAFASVTLDGAAFSKMDADVKFSSVLHTMVMLIAAVVLVAITFLFPLRILLNKAIRNGEGDMGPTTAPYKPTAKWWEGVSLLQRGVTVLLVGLPPMAGRPVLQAGVLLLSFLSYFLAVHFCKPFITNIVQIRSSYIDSWNVVEMTSFGVLAINAVAAAGADLDILDVPVSILNLLYFVALMGALGTSLCWSKSTGETRNTDEDSEATPTPSELARLGLPRAAGPAPRSRVSAMRKSSTLGGRSSRRRQTAVLPAETEQNKSTHGKKKSHRHRHHHNKKGSHGKRRKLRRADTRMGQDMPAFDADGKKRKRRGKMHRLKTGHRLSGIGEDASGGSHHGARHRHRRHKSRKNHQHKGAVLPDANAVKTLPRESATFRDAALARRSSLASIRSSRRKTQVALPDT